MRKVHTVLYAIHLAVGSKMLSLIPPCHILQTHICEKEREMAAAKPPPKTRFLQQQEIVQTYEPTNPEWCRTFRQQLSPTPHAVAITECQDHHGNRGCHGRIGHCRCSRRCPGLCAQIEREQGVSARENRANFERRSKIIADDREEGAARGSRRSPWDTTMTRPNRRIAASSPSSSHATAEGGEFRVGTLRTDLMPARDRWSRSPVPESAVRTENSRLFD